MKKIIENKAVGFYIELIAVLLTVAGLFLYTMSLYKEVSVYALLAAVVVLFLAASGISAVKGEHWLLRSVTLVNAVLTAAAVAAGAAPMVNQFGFVVSGLDPVSTVSGFLVFAGVGILAILFHIVASFVKYTK